MVGPDTHEGETITPLETAIVSRVNDLISKKIDFGFWYFRFGSMKESSTSRQQYKNNTLQIPFNQLEKLSEKDIYHLKQLFRNTILQHPDSGEISPDMSQMLDPDSDSNILSHEIEHLLPLPVDVKSESTVDIGLCFIDNKIALMGGANFDDSKVAFALKVQSALNPKVISNGDIKLANQWANESNDPKLIEYTKSTITLKPHHNIGID